MAFVSHRRRGDDRWLEWKVRLFSVAAVLGLAGIYFEERWMTGTAILVLAGGILLRLIPASEQADGHEAEGAKGDATRSAAGPGSDDDGASAQTEL